MSMKILLATFQRAWVVAPVTYWLCESVRRSDTQRCASARGRARISIETGIIAISSWNFRILRVEYLTSFA